jgi:hypothetical protein
MCNVYNPIGTLTTIRNHLRKNNINEFKSLNELINFQKNYTAIHQQIILNHTHLIEQEKETIGNELVQLDESIKTRMCEVEQQLELELENLKRQSDDLPSTHNNIIQALVIYFKKNNIRKKIRFNELTLSTKVSNSVGHLHSILSEKKNRYQYIASNFDEAVNRSSHSEQKELDRKKRIIDEINSFIYGVIGEHKVVKELENLNDDYFLINDFNCSFHPSLYNRQENDYIKSIQIDHLLISPAGIFLIETKNWSDQSLHNTSLRSPVEQIKRSSFALYKILSGEIIRTRLFRTQHHWGERKVTIRNLIVLTNHKPEEEFQHVKVLTIHELLRYIEYFKPCFSREETQLITDFLISLMDKRNGTSSHHTI